jgi:hypothetical protein
MLQAPAGQLWLAMVQSIPDPPGSRSFRMSSVAYHVPVFFSVIVKPICEPAFTEVASAVLVAIR